MINTRGQWFDTGLFLSLVSTFSFFIVFSCLDVDAQPESINVQNTIVTAPLTVIVPISADVQNAQICVSAASSGGQSCTQMILNPEQNSYEAVNVDLSDPASVPAVITETPGVSKTITPGSQRPDIASTNAHQPPVINIQNTVVTQPLTVIIPIETVTQNAQICVTIMSSGSQTCQQVALDSEQGSYTPVTVDLSQSTPIITPQETAQTSSSSTSNQPQTINVEHTVVTAPITVIVPITGDVQNAQICVSAGSSGDQSCTQLIVNPEQTSYTPVSTDLTTETPTVSSAVQQEPAAAIETANTPTTTESEQVPQTSTSIPPPQTEPARPTTNEETSQSQSPQEGESEGQPPETSEQSQEDDASNSNGEEGQESTGSEAP
jgi:hypothetical protein